MANIEIIDAVSILSQWYGPDSIACHRVKIINEKEVESEFVVGGNLCGLQARPPMFNRLMPVQDAAFTTDTTTEDAKQHFIESVGISVVPAHKVEGLAAEALKQTRYPDWEDLNEGYPYVVGFDFMRLRGFILPCQMVNFTGEITRDIDGATGTFTMFGQRRPFSENLRIEMGEELDEELKQRVLAQHWITEANAQGMGIVGLQSAPKDTAPVLMGVGKSLFEKVPIFAGDTIRSYFTIRAKLPNQVMGNAEAFVGNRFIAREEELLVQIFPFNFIKKKVDQARQRGTS